MRRVIGIDTHRTFGEVVIWEAGRLRHVGRIDMTRTALEGFGKELLATDEVVIEATGHCMAVSRVLTPFVKRVVIANPLHIRKCCRPPTPRRAAPKMRSRNSRVPWSSAASSARSK